MVVKQEVYKLESLMEVHKLESAIKRVLQDFYHGVLVTSTTMKPVSVLFKTCTYTIVKYAESHMTLTICVMKIDRFSKK